MVVEADIIHRSDETRSVRSVRTDDKTASVLLYRAGAGALNKKLAIEIELLLAGRIDEGKLGPLTCPTDIRYLYTLIIPRSRASIEVYGAVPIDLLLSKPL